MNSVNNLLEGIPAMPRNGFYLSYYNVLHSSDSITWKLHPVLSVQWQRDLKIDCIRYTFWKLFRYNARI